MNRMLAVVSALIFLVLPSTFSCNPKDPASSQPETCSDLTVIAPASGATLTAGSTVQIKWCFPSGWAYTQTLIDASISNYGFTLWKSIVVTPVLYPTNTFAWKIPADTSGDSCRIRVYDYDKNKYAYSGFFKITK